MFLCSFKTHILTDTQTHAHTYAHPRTHTYMHKNTNTRNHINTHTHTYTYAYTHEHTLIHEHTHNHTNTHTHTHTYTYTHIKCSLCNGYRRRKWTLLRRYVPRGLAGCCSFPPNLSVNADHGNLLWSAEYYLMSLIPPTPKRNHILKPLGEL